MSHLFVKVGLFKGYRIVCLLDNVGLGSRLGSLLRGIALAETLRAAVMFVWADTDNDGIACAEETFSSEFLAKHLLAPTEVKSRLILNLKPPVTIWALALLRLVYPAGVQLRLGRSHSSKGSLQTRIGLKSPSLESVFSQVAFAPDVEEVRTSARESGTIDLAIHVRRGDLKHGLARIGARYSEKVLPLPIVQEIIRSLPAETRILLVDNERVVPQMFLQRFPNVRRSSELEQSIVASAKVRTWHDFFLLTQAKTIVSGSSHFANSAAEIGGGKLLHWSDLVSHQKAKRVAVDFLEADEFPDNLERVLACDFVLSELRASLHPEEFGLLVTQGFALEPSNPAYALKISVDRIAQGDLAGAREVLDFSTSRSGLAALYHLATEWKRGHADLRFINLVRPDGIVRPDDWLMLETQRGRIPILDWWLLAGDLVRQPESVEALLADAHESYSSCFSQWDLPDHANLFQEALNAVPNETMPQLNAKVRFRPREILLELIVAVAQRARRGLRFRS